MRQSLGHVRAPASVRGSGVDRRTRPPAALQFLAPMNCQLVSKLPVGKNWIYEVKFDGVRVLAIKNRHSIELYSRNQKEVSLKYPPVARALLKMRCRQAIIDGEVVALDSAGRPSFQLLQSRNIPGAAAHSLYYYVFDLLNLEGKSLLNLPLVERKRSLGEIVPLESTVIRLSLPLRSSPETMIKEITRLGFEGIIGKKIDSQYEVGRRSGAWVKYKLTNEQEFVIGGYTPPEGSRSYFGAILVGFFEGGDLKFASKVGSGFNGRNLAELYRRFQTLKVAACPFSNLPEPSTFSERVGLTRRAMRACAWIRPSLVCQVRFTEWTRDGHLRHPVYLGLREDKSAKEVKREVPK